MNGEIEGLTRDELISAVKGAELRCVNISAERDAAEVVSNQLANDHGRLVNELTERERNLREMSRCLRALTEERDLYQAAIYRTWGFKARFWLIRVLSPKDPEATRS